LFSILVVPEVKKRNHKQNQIVVCTPYYLATNNLKKSMKVHVFDFQYKFFDRKKIFTFIHFFDKKCLPFVFQFTISRL